MSSAIVVRYVEYTLYSKARISAMARLVSRPISMCTYMEKEKRERGRRESSLLADAQMWPHAKGKHVPFALRGVSVG